MASYMSIVQTDMHAGMRAILVDWLVEVSLVSTAPPTPATGPFCWYLSHGLTTIPSSMCMSKLPGRCQPRPVLLVTP